MATKLISAAGQVVPIGVDPAFAEDVQAFFPMADDGPATITPVLSVRAVGEGFRIEGLRYVRDGLSRGDALEAVRACAANAAEAATGVVLHAGAVGWGDKAIIVAAQPKSGASSVVAWLIENGFSYLADDTAVVRNDPPTVAGLAAPLGVEFEGAAHLSTLKAFREARGVRAGGRLLIAPELTWVAPEGAMPIGLILFVQFDAGAALELAPVEKPAWRLLEATRTVVLPGEAKFGTIDGLASAVPMLSLRYGHYAQLDGVLDFLCRTILDAGSEITDVQRFLDGIRRSRVAAPAGAPEPAKLPIPPRTDRRLHRRLTIGMSTYDDFDGTYFSIQAIRMYHPEVLADVELLVVDNHPDGKCGLPLKALENAIDNYRYVPAAGVTGTSIRNQVFAEASGDFVLCMDCHVFVVPGALKRLLGYFQANPDKPDLVQGPMVADDLGRISTHLDPVWQNAFFGAWGTDPRGVDPDAPPFDIGMQGLALFACRRSAWPGFNPLFRGFGGEEGYIHEKVRQRGGRTLCLPFLRWLHRFQRPLGIPYPILWKDRLRNYMIGHRELGLPTQDLEAHFRQVLGDMAGEQLIRSVRRELGLAEHVNAT